MLPSSLPRAPSTSSKMVQPKKYVFQSFLLLSGPFKIPQARGTSPRTLDIPPSTPPRIPHRVIYPCAYTLPTGPPSTTTNLDGPTANTDRAAFDALRPRSFRSPPRTRTQRTSDHLAYGAKGHGSSTSMLACRQYSGRDRCPS